MKTGVSLCVLVFYSHYLCALLAEFPTMLIRSHELGIYIQILNSLKRQEKWEKLNQGFYGPHDCQAVADFEAATNT